MKALILALALPLVAQEASDTHGAFGATGNRMAYGPGSDRERLQEAGAFLDVDFRQSGGFKLQGASGTILQRDGTTSKEQTGFVSMRFYGGGQKGEGKLLMQVDAFGERYQPQVAREVKTHGFGFHLGYLSDIDPEKADHFFDAAYYSTQYDSGLRVGQFTPTFGFGFSENREWIQLAADLITLQDPAYPDWSDHEVAFRLSWSHYLQPGWAIKPKSFILAAQVGRRAYAVDPDLGLLLTIPQAQGPGGSLGLTWKGRSGLGLTVTGSAYRYLDRPSGEALYTARALAASLHFSW
jgi:hypothetical protein